MGASERMEAMNIFLLYAAGDGYKEPDVLLGAHRTLDGAKASAEQWNDQGFDLVWEEGKDGEHGAECECGYVDTFYIKTVPLED